MTYLSLPDRTAYSIRANLIIVETLITAKIQTGHRAPQIGKMLEFEQACGIRILRRGIWPPQDNNPLTLSISPATCLSAEGSAKEDGRGCLCV
jgi:hypothetical protein